MKGLDDGPDGLNDRAFESALGAGGGRKGRRKRGAARTDIGAATSTSSQLALPPSAPVASAARRELEGRIVELARRWYRHGNEAELSAAVVEFEALLKEETEARNAARAGMEP